MKISDTFSTRAESIMDTFISDSGSISFRIPIYQREYNWSKEDIDRLFGDVLSAISSLEKDKDSLAYIGTIILINESNKEQTFEGTSLAVVDGQQRLTTISLICCELQELLLNEIRNLDEQNPILFSWLKDEIEKLLDNLWDCTIGMPGGRSRDFEADFPRIVRQKQDKRGHKREECEYTSFIAKYQYDFANFIRNNSADAFEYEPFNIDENFNNFKNNIDCIKKILVNIRDVEGEIYFSNGYKLIENDNFRKAIFKKLNNEDISNLKSILKESDSECFSSTFKLILFARFFLDRVAVTKVITDTEKYAFEIFDSLNTTGQPLTAFETLKPLIIEYEELNNHKGYEGSKAKKFFDLVENYLDDAPIKEREKYTREIVVHLALYYKGEKISESQNSQRNFLRKEYRELKSVEDKQKFIKSISEIVEFRRRFWHQEQLLHELRDVPREREVVLFCLDFIRGMKTTLVIPILNRFFCYAEATKNLELFCEAVKAITAFIVIRRSATGTTSGIDSDFRLLMRNEKIAGKSVKPLMIESFSAENEIPEINEFKSYLRYYLKNSMAKIQSKSDWMYRFKSLPIYERAPKILIKFIILCASHNSIIDVNKPYLLCKDSRKNPHFDYLNLRSIRNDDFKTIEHIAPDQPLEGWAEDVYEDPNLKHSVGNLSLLPEKENSAVGRRSWDSKKIYYRSFAAIDSIELSKCMEDAKDAGMEFGKRTKSLLYEGNCLPLISNIVNADIWNRNVIIERSENFGNLLWEEICTWIGFDNL